MIKILFFRWKTTYSLKILWKCQLNQAQIGQKAVFGDELGVVRDDGRRSDRFAEVAKVLVGDDVIVTHGQERCGRGKAAADRVQGAGANRQMLPRES